MARDDHFKIIYVILTELYECKKANCPINMAVISPQRFQIQDGYLLDILSDLLEEGYVKGFDIINTKTGRCVLSIEDIKSTMKGTEYLQDNSKMKQVYSVLKEVKDWVPGL